MSGVNMNTFGGYQVHFKGHMYVLSAGFCRSWLVNL